MAQREMSKQQQAAESYRQIAVLAQDIAKSYRLGCIATAVEFASRLDTMMSEVRQLDAEIEVEEFGE